MSRSLILAAILVAGLVGIASAANLRHNTGPYEVATSGMVKRDGVILGGEGFTVTHHRLGEYIVTFQPNYFGYSGCAALVVEGIHRPLLSRVHPDCSGSSTTMRIQISDPYGGGWEDHDFMFVAVGFVRNT